MDPPNKILYSIKFTRKIKREQDKNKTVTTNHYEKYDVSIW